MVAATQRCNHRKPPRKPCQTAQQPQIFKCVYKFPKYSGTLKPRRNYLLSYDSLATGCWGEGRGVGLEPTTPVREILIHLINLLSILKRKSTNSATGCGSGRGTAAASAGHATLAQDHHRRHRPPVPEGVQTKCSCRPLLINLIPLSLMEVVCFKHELVMSVCRLFAIAHRLYKVEL